jgi:hypothetical protein
MRSFGASCACEHIKRGRIAVGTEPRAGQSLFQHVVSLRWPANVAVPDDVADGQYRTKPAARGSYPWDGDMGNVTCFWPFRRTPQVEEVQQHRDSVGHVHARESLDSHLSATPAPVQYPRVYCCPCPGSDKVSPNDGHWTTVARIIAGSGAKMA